MACGGGSPGITDPIDDDPDIPVDTAVANAAKRTAATNELLTQINDALTALGQSAGAGGVGGPQGSNAEAAGGPIVGGSPANLANTPPPPDAAKCTFDDATMRWNCPDFTQQNGFVVRSWFQFLDAENQPHKVIDTLKTVAIRRFVGTTGTATTQHTGRLKPSDPPMTVPAQNTVDNTDTLVLSGLKGPPAGRKLNGKGSIKSDIVPQGLPTGHATATTTTENFAFVPPPAPGTPPTVRYPISGKITAVVTSYREDAPNNGSTTTQVTTFDGTKIAKLVITTAQGKVILTCTYDMTAQNTAPSCTATP